MITRRVLTIALGAALLGGCRTETIPAADTPVPIAHGTAAEFSPLLSAPSGTGRCEVAEADPAVPGARAIAWVRGSRTEQRVTVQVDSQGRPFRFMDVRTQPSLTYPEAANRTTIGLYLTEGYAVLGNRPAGQEARIFEVPLEEASMAENLGKPIEMLQFVMNQCGRGAGD